MRAARKEISVEMPRRTQAIIPEEFLKNVLPKIPSKTNPTRGSNGISGVDK